MRDIRRKSRGFLFADAIIAIGVVSILITTLGVALNKQSRASAQLAEQRAQVRLAEQVMTVLQTGGRAPDIPKDFRVKISRISGPQDVVAGMAWARVSVTHGSHAAELVGVVPAAAVKDALP